MIIRETKLCFGSFVLFFFCFVFFLFFFLFWSLSSHSKMFHSYGDVNITGEGLQIFTYARHSWPLSSEGSLACKTYCDTGHPVIMVISEDPWHSHLLPSVWQLSCHYLFLRLWSVATGDRTPISHTGGKSSTSTPSRRFFILNAAWFFVNICVELVKVTQAIGLPLSWAFKKARIMKIEDQKPSS